MEELTRLEWPMLLAEFIVRCQCHLSSCSWAGSTLRAVSQAGWVCSAFALRAASPMGLQETSTPSACSIPLPPSTSAGGTIWVLPALPGVEATAVSAVKSSPKTWLLGQHCVSPFWLTLARCSSLPCLVEGKGLHHASRSPLQFSPG